MMGQPREVVVEGGLPPGFWVATDGEVVELRCPVHTVAYSSRRPIAPPDLRKRAYEHIAVGPARTEGQS